MVRGDSSQRTAANSLLKHFLFGKVYTLRNEFVLPANFLQSHALADNCRLLSVCIVRCIWIGRYTVDLGIIGDRTYLFRRDDNHDRRRPADCARAQPHPGRCYHPRRARLRRIAVSSSVVHLWSSAVRYFTTGPFVLKQLLQGNLPAG